MSPRQQQAMSEFHKLLNEVSSKLIVRSFKSKDASIRLELGDIGVKIQNWIKLNLQNMKDAPLFCNQLIRSCNQTLDKIMRDDTLRKKCVDEIALLTDMITKIDVEKSRLQIREPSKNQSLSSGKRVEKTLPQPLKVDAPSASKKPKSKLSFLSFFAKKLSIKTGKRKKQKADQGPKLK